MLNGRWSWLELPCLTHLVITGAFLTDPDQSNYSILHLSGKSYLRYVCNSQLDLPSLTRIQLTQGSKESCSAFNTVVFNSLPFNATIELNKYTLQNVEYCHGNSAHLIQAVKDNRHRHETRYFTSTMQSFSLPISTTHAILDNNSCKQSAVNSAHWNQCQSLQFIHIGNNCLQQTSHFTLTKLPHLHSIIIGKQAFKAKQYRHTGEFSISRCPQLTSIRIGQNSLQEVATVKLIDLPQLGVIEMPSKAFPYCELFILSKCDRLEEFCIPEMSFTNITSFTVSGIV